MYKKRKLKNKRNEIHPKKGKTCLDNGGRSSYLIYGKLKKLVLRKAARIFLHFLEEDQLQKCYLREITHVNVEENHVCSFIICNPV